MEAKEVIEPLTGRSASTNALAPFHWTEPTATAHRSRIVESHGQIDVPPPAATALTETLITLQVVQPISFPAATKIVGVATFAVTLTLLLGLPAASLAVTWVTSRIAQFVTPFIRAESHAAVCAALSPRY